MKKIRYVVIFVIILFSLFIFGLSLYNVVELDVRYDSRTMKCNFSNNKLIYEMYGTSVLNTKYVEKNIDSKKYLVFHSTINLSNKRHSNFEYGYSFAQLNDGKEVTYGFRIILDHFKEDEKIVVYYSNDNLNKIRKLSNSEFLFNLTKYQEMCKNN